MSAQPSQPTLFSFFKRADPQSPEKRRRMGELNLVPVPGTSPVNRTKTASGQWAPPAVVGQQAPETVVSTSPAKKRKGMGTLQLFGREKLDEETALLHKAHLSPSLGENELAKRWEFASVLCFYGLFGKEIYGSCKSCLQRHAKREKAIFKSRRVKYEDEDVFRACFFTSHQLLRALECSPSPSDDANFLADVHVVLLKALHPTSRIPPTRQNWLCFLRTAVVEKWDSVCFGSVPPSAFGTSIDPSLGSNESDEETLMQRCAFTSRADKVEAEEEKLMNQAYKGMSSYERLQCLRLLCELVGCETKEVKARADKAVVHTNLTKKTKDMVAEMKAGAPPMEVTLQGGKKISLAGPLEFVEDLRMDEPYAKDYYGRRYWLLSLYPEQGHCFLIREEKPSSSSPSISTGTRGAAAGEPLAPAMELVCANGDEFLAFVEDHVDVTLFGAATRRKLREGEVFAEIRRHKEEAIKVTAARDKVKSQLGDKPFSEYGIGGLRSDLLGSGPRGTTTDEGGVRRSTRTRKPKAPLVEEEESLSETSSEGPESGSEESEEESKESDEDFKGEGESDSGSGGDSSQHSDESEDEDEEDSES